MELLILAMLTSYLVVAPDKITLGATRGAAGSARAAYGRTSRGRARAAKRAARSATGSRTAPGSAKTTGGSQSPSLWRDMADGWREGTRRAHTRRAQGQDAWARMRRGAVRGATTLGHVNARMRPRTAPVPAVTPTPAPTLAPVPTDQPDPGPETVPAPAETNPEPTRKAGITFKETPLMGNIKVTELETLDAYIAELDSVINASEGAGAYLDNVKEWGASFADRNSGKGWSTSDTDSTATAVTEAAVKLPTMADFLDVLVEARDAAVKARSLGEVAAELGARGDVAAFNAA